MECNTIQNNKDIACTCRVEPGAGPGMHWSARQVRGLPVTSLTQLTVSCTIYNAWYGGRADETVARNVKYDVNKVYLSFCNPMPS